MDLSAQQDLLPFVVVFLMLTIGCELDPEHFKKRVREPKVTLLRSLIHTLVFPLVALTLVLLALELNVEISEASLIGILRVAALPTVYMMAVLTLALGFSLLWRRRSAAGMA